MHSLTDSCLSNKSATDPSERQATMDGRNSSEQDLIIQSQEDLAGPRSDDVDKEEGQVAENEDAGVIQQQSVEETESRKDNEESSDNKEETDESAKKTSHQKTSDNIETVGNKETGDNNQKSDNRAPAEDDADEKNEGGKEGENDAAGDDKAGKCETAEDAETEKEERIFKPNPKFSSLEEALEQIKKYLAYLKEQEAYDNKEVLTILKSIGRCYFNYKKKSQRAEVSKLLVELEYPAEVKKMTVYFNRVGVFRNDDVWFPCYYNLNTVWNFTDSSITLSKALVEVGMIHYYILNLSHQPYLDNRSSKNVAFVLKASISTLQNLIRHCPESKPLFHDEKASEVLSPFLNDKDDFMKCVAILTLSAVMSEDETSKMEDTGYIGFIVKAIRSSLKSEKRRYRGFTPLELTEGLARIAVSDFNKKKIVDTGALELLVQLMNTKNENEQLHAAKTVWTLCFDEYSRQKVKEEPDCEASLGRLKLSESAEVRHAASGALWKLQEEEAHRQEKPAAGVLESDQHIFLSYNHEHSEMVHQVKDRLKADGYKIWIDSEQMGGSTLEAMAEAVEKAAVVLVCASEKYKLSPNCRTEAEYTFQLKRPIVPLMMQRRYKPDGWLGMLMGAKKYVNFDGKFEFDYAYQMLVREVLRYLKTGEGADFVEGQTPAVTAASAAPTFSGPVPPTPPEHVARIYESAKWTKEEVQEWIRKCEFNSILNTKLQTLLSSMDGKLLVALCNIKTRAADFFYNHLYQQCDADMFQLVYLTNALDQLP